MVAKPQSPPSGAARIAVGVSVGRDGAAGTAPLEGGGDPINRQGFVIRFQASSSSFSEVT